MQVVLKEDCSITIIQHTRLRTLLGLIYQVQIRFNGVAYNVFNEGMPFKRMDQVPSFANPRKFARLEAQRFVENLPENLLLS